jgi:tetratricopeptide (TPR) repeat protein
VPFVAVDPATASATDRAIGAAQDRLRTEPTNAKARLALAQAFLQKARETADPTLYGKADALLASLPDDDPGALVARGVLALARHQFTDGLRLGRAALAAAPGSEAALGIIVDASNELGRYDEAVDATQRMVDTKPNLASYSRVSYARELHGDLDGAVTAMDAAVEAGGTMGGENVAYVQTQLGLLLLTTGDLAGAGRALDAADVSFPGFPPVLVARARLLLAQHRDADAAALLTRAAEVQPLAETVALQADTLAAIGDAAGARRAESLVAAIAKLYRANGVRTDLEMALFDADHHPGADAVAAARRALAERPSILGHDVLAWNLFRAGDAEAAWPEVQRALATGSHDPQLRFHAAVIAEATGHRAAARQHLASVLRTNPRFSPRHDHTIEALADQIGLAKESMGLATTGTGE